MREFYKTFKYQIVPYLKDLFGYCIRVNRIPDSWKKARLTLIKKEGKEDGFPSSCRPILLLNLDYKTPTSIMAERLNKIISNYVKEVQKGFIQGRMRKDNIWKLMDVVDLLQRRNRPAVIVFLDAEKVFDHIVTYLKQVLDRFGFGV